MYPLFEDFYNSSNLGDVTVAEYFGISPYWFTAFITIIAIASFYVTMLIRKRVKDVKY
jgi:hypothetical protein